MNMGNVMYEVRCASTSVIWSASPYFQSNIFHYFSSSASHITVLSATYNIALTGPPTKMPAISLYNLNYRITGPNLSFEFIPLSWTATNIQIQSTLQNYQSCTVSFGYIAIDPSIPFAVSSNYFLQVYIIIIIRRIHQQLMVRILKIILSISRYLLEVCLILLMRLLSCHF